MKYRISVQITEPYSDEERMEQRRTGQYRGLYDGERETYPMEKVVRTLDVVLTEEEWKAVKKAVLEVM